MTLNILASKEIVNEERLSKYLSWLKDNLANVKKYMK